ncbi:TipAS antibiotic-recognition domain-containing protein [Paenibacillus harenae]|uniref:TipAS antibiotic-recognition domain-containing protein n=1 Tax=Paenibacillus harenae TaxID=306543 RepID=UPI000490C8F7|nr:TipAS antibiotic-recognition domain-containing protein [Paenibacillus harenae]
MSGVWEYFTPEQQDFLSRRIEQIRQSYGPEEMKRLRVESNKLISKLRSAYESGLPSDALEVVAFAKRLAESQAMFNGGDRELEKAVERFHVENPDVEDHGIDLKLYRYIEQAKSYCSAE